MKIEINGFDVYKVSTILNQLDDSITSKKPFSITRFGDGTIKAIHSFLKQDLEQLEGISKQEGIPINVFSKIIEMWKNSANNCDYIDTPEVYFSNGIFWERTKGEKMKGISDKTIKRLKMWKTLYDIIGITNYNYCNPEINFLSCIAKPNKKSLVDLLKDKKICCISSRNDVEEKLSKYFNIKLFKIVGKNENQFENSFYDVLDKICSDSKKFDIWLIAAGELGRVYPGLIKFKEGRAFDIGSLIDFWCGDSLPSRLLPYLKTTIHHPLKVTFTELGKEYAKFI